MDDAQASGLVHRQRPHLKAEAGVTRLATRTALFAPYERLSWPHALAPDAKAATVSAGVVLLAWDATAGCSLPTDVEPRPEMPARHWR